MSTVPLAGELALAPSTRLVVVCQHDGQIVDVHLAVGVRVAGHDLIDPHIVEKPRRPYVLLVIAAAGQPATINVNTHGKRLTN